MHNPNPNSNYDVFLSFNSRGDVAKSFSSDLSTCLQKAGISVFLDDDSLSGDDQISPSLLRVIQRCRLFVVVLSNWYAGSRRCLEVLEQIIECRRIAGQFVLPVFSGISHHEVRYQEGGFGKAFGDLTERISDKDKVESWKIALSRICQVQSDIIFHQDLEIWPWASSGKRWWCRWGKSSLAITLGMGIMASPSRDIFSKETGIWCDGGCPCKATMVANSRTMLMATALNNQS